MTIAYFDCFAGISGDMTLGALVDAGGDLAVVEAAVEALGLAGEVSLSSRRGERGHLGGTQVLVETREGPARTLPQLRETVSRAGLPEAVRARTLEALDRIGTAESAIHGVDESDLHLHELGGADTLVDLAGAFWLLQDLEVEHAFASPLPAPRGSLGSMPLPAPASLRILEGTGAVLEPDSRTQELVTPTGAAILATVATFTRPALQLNRVGYGLGGRPDPGNALAVWLGEPAPQAGTGSVDVIETNLDDMAPNLIAALMEDLLDAGALDVTVTPVLMKKGRPGHTLSVISAHDVSARLTQLLLGSSTTLGVRVNSVPRVIAERESIEVESAVGRARVKVKRYAGRVEVSAEHDDCLRLSRQSGRDLREVKRLVEEAARRELGIT